MVITAAILVAVITFTLVVIVVADEQKLVLRDTETGEEYLAFELAASASFSVTFTHSVNATDVTEHYEVREGGIYLTCSEYYGFGAGVADTLLPHWELSFGDKGEMIISEIDMFIPELIYRVGTVSDHVLSYNGEEYSLRTLCGRNTSVSFVIE